MTPAALKAWRKHLGLSQKAAGKAIGVSHSSVQKYESGAMAIPLTVELACAAVALGVRGYAGPEMGTAHSTNY